MKINADVIARTSLRLLNEVGLDGLTMRLVAKELDVKAPALYWHLKSKQELLDAMAALVMIEAVEGLESPRPGASWEEWLSRWAGRLRATMLRYRDGARVVAGTHVGHPAVFRLIEVTLRHLGDAGFTQRDAARLPSILLHYTIGFTIEEQARLGDAYAEGRNPYRPELVAEIADAERFPLTAQMVGEIFHPDPGAEFEDGVRVILAGMRAARLDG
ncbi:TetR/AcrR family transcriptional regulator C-terminal domain-containing protein [Sphaerisporangium fuscum]|uniref:TetR/AcrR family transcriptional regulator C-terminal domain-containing protein n=1 Tax=Sphaerisporangium fuscum TaxID=2835868 RepID=UPI001BDD1702|nr:TetR/AcrR family transcriptional regulator C-terminal domain-containing protein [Sphaerisporangium fuscum]